MRARLVAVVLVSLGGCAAHGTMRGSVVMKISDTEAHVCMGKGEVREGDRVDLYSDVCKPDGIRVSCRRASAGSGTVEKVLDDHYSVVRFTPGTRFEEGDTVEARGRK